MLLEQFAYFDTKTGSQRLWRYERGRQPYWKASPRTATRIDGHFSDPEDAEKEAEVETRLAREFEDPVNDFIEQVGYRTFVPSQTHIRHLTAYVSLLFHRSKARRAATQQQLDIAVESYKSLLSNDVQLSQLAGKWTLDIIGGGHRLDRVVSTREVADAVTKMINDQLASTQLQHTYAGTMERAMERLDENMINGRWNVLHTDANDPFVIGDAPVVTWERNDRNFLIHGQGFGKPNVEAFLPVSPIACLHILPQVQRTRRVITPTTKEVNEAEAAFASDYCYTNIRSDALDAILQPMFGRARLGINAFSVRHRDYKNTMFDLLMSGGKWVAPPEVT